MLIRKTQGIAFVASTLCATSFAYAEVRVVLPTDEDIDSSHIVPLQASYMVDVANGAMTMEYDLTLREGKNYGEPALLLQTLLTMQQETVSDVASFASDTLAVQWRNYRFPGGNVGVMVYVGDVARGQVVSPEGGEPKVTEIEIDGPVFSEAGLPYLFSSMTLEEHSKLQVPIVSLNTSAKVDLDVTVGEMERIELGSGHWVDAWNVSISGPVGEQTLLVSKEPPYMLEMTTDFKGSAPMVISLTDWSLLETES